MKKITKTEFVKSHGFTCNNWRISWSFINEKEKIILSPVCPRPDGKLLVFSEDFRFYKNGKKQPGYKQTCEHVCLIEEEDYDLKIAYTDESFSEFYKGQKLWKKILSKEKHEWYAIDESGNHLPEEISDEEEYTEGAIKQIRVNVYERNAAAREKCVQEHGYKCAVCSFDFEEIYGKWGQKYIHVHHNIPLSEIKGEYNLDPKNDLTPLCPNCHAMIHRQKPALSVEELKSILKNHK